MSELARVVIPAMFPNDESVIVTACYVACGEKIAEGTDILSLEFSKAAVEIPSPASGFVRLLCKEQDEVRVGELVAIIFETAEEALAGELSKTPEVAVTVTTEKERTRETALVAVSDDVAPIFSAAAQQLVQQLGLDASSFRGVPFVRVADVRNLSGQRCQGDILQGKAKQAEAHTCASKSIPLPSVLPFTSEVAMAGKAAEAKNLLSGQNLVTSNFQKTLMIAGGKTAQGGAFGGLGAIPVLLRACCLLLKKFRHLNGFYHEGALNYYDDVNVGYAIDMGKGLQVANLGDLSECSDKEITLKIMTSVKSYMLGKLSVQDMSSVTFVVTDLSNEQVEYFTPLLGKWQSGTLGVCSPDASSGAFKVSLTFDHRMTEGRLAATFLRELAKAVC